MKTAKLMLFAIGMIFIFMQTAEAQNPVTSFGDNLRSGAIANSIGNLARDTIFLWYTTVNGDLNPAYENQRKIIDLMLFFAFFSSVILFSLGRVWKDAKAKTRNMVAISAGFALSIGLIAAGGSAAIIVKHINSFLFLILTIGLTLLFNAIINKDGKDKGKFIMSLIAAIILSWLAINAFNLFAGKDMSLIGNAFNTEANSNFAARIIGSGDPYGSKNAGVNLALAKDAIRRYDYPAAKKYFALVIESAPPSSSEFKEATRWLSKNQGDKLYEHMAAHYPALIEAELAAANVFYEEAIATKDIQKQKALLLRAKALADDAKAKIKILKDACLERASDSVCSGNTGGRS